MNRSELKKIFEEFIARLDKYLKDQESKGYRSLATSDLVLSKIKRAKESLQQVLINTEFFQQENQDAGSLHPEYLQKILQLIECLKSDLDLAAGYLLVHFPDEHRMLRDDVEELERIQKRIQGYA